MISAKENYQRNPFLLKMVVSGVRVVLIQRRNKMNIFWLIFAHFVGDIPLQPPEMVNKKHTEPFWMMAHCFIWTGCICITLTQLGLFDTWKIYFLLFGHWSIDRIKCNGKINLKQDQILHLAQLLIVGLF